MIPNDEKRHEFTFGGKEGGEFLLDGQPFQIRAGEMHPQRIPKEYWSHRVAMAKAMGLNTIAFYAMWNDFEQADGSFDFETGNRDLAGFLNICRDEGMWVLFRPGPYACGEWDFGGIPSRLLKYLDLKIRTLTDERFMAAQTAYLAAIAAVVSPFRVSEGGPILMTQLENEYGSCQRREHDYMLWLQDFWTEQGFGPFYTSDGASENHLKDVVLPGVAVGLDPGETDQHWHIAQKMNPGVPIFSSETYPGWLRHWGEGMGHINFNIAMESDRKGLFGDMTLGDTRLNQWTVSPLPLSAADVVETKNASDPSERPGSHFRATFTVESSPADTFLDMSKYDKGMVWVNGHNLGRYWSVGPQLRLYCPGVWLKKGKNIVDIIDLELVAPRPIRGCEQRNYDMKNAATRNANNEW
jgi:beta-galactosidase GanA